MLKFDRVVWFIKEGLAPSRCVGCQRVETWLCGNCAGQILFLKEQNCYRCGRLSIRGRTCERCRTHTALYGVAIAAHFEAGPVRKLVHELKYGGLTELAVIMGEMLARTIVINRLQDFILVPVPLHHRRQLARGFNQAELLVQQVGRQLGMPQNPMLVRNRSTESQTQLMRGERQINVWSAFECRGDVAGQDLLLVDDVMTTGATLEECARTLKAAGARRVWAVVVARG